VPQAQKQVIWQVVAVVVVVGEAVPRNCHESYCLELRHDPAPEQLREHRELRHDQEPERRHDLRDRRHRGHLRELEALLVHRDRGPERLEQLRHDLRGLERRLGLPEQQLRAARRFRFRDQLGRFLEPERRQELEEDLAGVVVVAGEAAGRFVVGRRRRLHPNSLRNRLRQGATAATEVDRAQESEQLVGREQEAMVQEKRRASESEEQARPNRAFRRSANE
jgi:hypothetical protein